MGWVLFWILLVIILIIVAFAAGALVGSSFLLIALEATAKEELEWEERTEFKNTLDKLLKRN